MTVEEGLNQLNRVCTLEVTFADGVTINRTLEPNEENVNLLKAVNVVLPEVLPHYDVNVGSKKELQKARKSA